MAKTAIRILLVVLVVGPAAAVGWWWYQHERSQVVTYTVEEGDLLQGVTVSGTVECKQKTAVAAETVATVRALPVDEGQEVAGGAVLVELDDRVIAADCQKAQASLEAARQELAELKAGARQQELTQAREAVKQAQARFAYAQKDRKKVADLLQRGVGTQAEVDLVESRLSVAEAELRAAEARLNLLLAGARAERIGRAEAEVALAEAEVERCTALRAKHVLRAPHAGTVTVRYVHVGEVVSPGDVLLRLDNRKTARIRAQVQESQLPAIRLGGQARVLADAHPDRPQQAVVEDILPRVTPESGTVTVLLKLSGAPTIDLMDGMAVDVALLRESRKGVLRVPIDAVEGIGDRAFVYVRQGGGFVRRRIRTGVSDEHWIEVCEGLKAGDVVRAP